MVMNAEDYESLITRLVEEPEQTARMTIAQELRDDYTQVIGEHTSLTDSVEDYKTKYHDSLENASMLFRKNAITQQEDDEDSKDEEIVTVNDLFN